MILHTIYPGDIQSARFRIGGRQVRGRSPGAGRGTRATQERTVKKSNFALRLQRSLMEETRRVAKAEGVAVNQLINVAVAEKISALRTEEYFAERTRRASPEKIASILQRVGKGRGDELAPAFKSNLTRKHK